MEEETCTSDFASPTMSSPQSSVSPSPRRNDLPPAKKQRITKEKVDEAVLQLSKSFVERQKQKERREAEKRSEVRRNPEGNYGMEVAQTLNRFNPHQRALAKMKIQQLLFEIEFPNFVDQPL